jgi:hypothetical protein
MRVDRHREAWTALVEGREAKRAPKYGNVREGQYASKREAYVATQLAALARCGEIKELREQVPYILIPADGRLRAIRYIADFVYRDDDGLHVVDVKGGEATKTPVYRLKRRLMRQVHGIIIEEL